MVKSNQQEVTLFDLFDKEISLTLEEIKVLLLVKGKEYSRNNNPFHNFDIGSQITGKTEFEVLDGFFLKHYISYRDMLEDISRGKIIDPALVDEKFNDMITYLLLQKAMIKLKNGRHIRTQ